MSHWENPPPVVVLSGTEEFLRLRELKEAVSVADRTGRLVDYYPEPDMDDIQSLISSSGLFFKKQKHLIIINKPADIDADMVLRHHDRKKNRVVLVLHHEGALPKSKKKGLGKVVHNLPSNFVARFEAVKSWEKEEQAINFVVNEAKKLGIEIDPKWALALVANSDENLGVLSFEVQKLAWLIDGERREDRKVKPEDVRATIAAFSEIGPKAIVNGLERRDRKAVSRALANMRRTSGPAVVSATLRACGFVSRALLNWLHVASLDAQGASPEEISQRVGIHSFVVKKNLLPASRKWGEETLTSLLKGLAKVERNAKSGGLNPWVELEAALFRHLVRGPAG
jgi:DNA polymerase III delta subunit